MKLFLTAVLIVFISALAMAETIKLIDGSIIKGKIVSQDERSIIVETALGELKIDKSTVQSIEYRESSPAQPRIEQRDKTYERYDADEIIDSGRPLYKSGRDSRIERPDRAYKDSGREYERLSSLVYSRSYMNPAGLSDMRSISADMSYETRTRFYSLNQRNDAWAGLLGNILLPSLGSWVQGDVGGALFIDLTILGGWLLMNFSYNQYAYSPYNYDGYGSYTYSSSYYVYNGLFITGAISVVVGIIYNYIAPFGYQNACNEQLRKGLSLAHSKSVYRPLFARVDSVINLDLVRLSF